VRSQLINKEIVSIDDQIRQLEAQLAIDSENESEETESRNSDGGRAAEEDTRNNHIVVEVANDSGEVVILKSALEGIAYFLA
jgi:hypothetical protein